MMRAENPCLQIGEDKVNHGQVGVGLLRIAREDDRLLLVAWRRQFPVNAPAIGSHRRTFCDAVRYKRDQAVGVAAFYHSQPEPARVNEFLERHAALMVLAVFRRTVFGVFTQPDLYGPDDRCPVVHPFALAPRAPANQALVHLDGVHAADAVALWPNHTGPELMENLEGCFVARKSELALELKCGLAGCLGCHQIGRPEPDGKRRMRGLHHRRSRQRRVDLAISAAQDHRGARRKTIWLILMAAVGADKPGRSSAMPQGTWRKRRHPEKLFGIPGGWWRIRVGP